jgi:DNA (cytosine-5)-methyltransferase 1
MKFLSVCSGIEAASVAWNPLGWSAAAFSEIEPYPCALLKHRYPNVPNFGDMNDFEHWDYESIGTVDLLCGGTPCQSFSVAGLRAGLADPRGNLMLTFGAIANAVRAKWLVWENVAGVLHSNGGRDFGTFLGLLAKLGYGFAYKVYDAQYFGLAQRRKRVFIVGYFGDWRRAAAVLFERHSLSGNPAPSREMGQEVASTITASTGGCSGKEGRGLAWPAKVTTTFDASFYSKQGLVNQHVNSGCPLFVPMAYRIAGDGAVYSEGLKSSPLTTGTDKAANVICFDTTQITSPQNRANPKLGDPCHTLLKESHPPAIAYGLYGNWIGRSPEHGGNASEPTKNISPCLTKTDVHAVAFSDDEKKGPTLNSMKVRRLTPLECERLMGFPDGYTQIPHKGKPAADSPRYKALGNSWAVPNVAWIGRRIAQVDAIKSSELVA